MLAFKNQTGGTLTHLGGKLIIFCHPVTSLSRSLVSRITGAVHFISKVVDYDMDIQSVLELPRLFPKPGADEVEIESTFSTDIRQTLSDRGFNMVDPSWEIGGGQVIWIDHENGVLYGASDHRKDGCALGY